LKQRDRQALKITEPSIKPLNVSQPLVADIPQDAWNGIAHSLYNI
jgi:hypothetical protein